MEELKWKGQPVPDKVPISFRLPGEMWFALKVLEHYGKISSLQAACIEGFERIILDRKEKRE